MRRCAELLAFSLGFLTLNLGFGLGGEYSPVLMAAYLLLVSGPPANADLSLSVYLAVLCGVVSGLVMGNAIQPSDIVRVSVGPLFFAFGPYFTTARSRPHVAAACELLFAMHLAWLLLFVSDESVARSLYSEIGLRAADYVGQNSFFSSEPSYAALNAGFLYVLHGLTTARSVKLRTVVSLCFVAVVLSTKSVTGWALAVTALLTSFELRWRSIGGIVFVAAAASAMLENGGRVSQVIAALRFITDVDSLAALSLIEPSGAWRLLVNLASLSLVSLYPFGTGKLLLGSYLNSLPVGLQEAITSNPTYALVPDVSPQAILASFSMFCGVAGLLVVAAIMRRSVVGLLRVIKNKSLDLIPRQTSAFALVYIIIGAFWQSALTAPGWWAVCGMACAMARSLRR